MNREANLKILSLEGKTQDSQHFQLYKNKCAENESLAKEVQNIKFVVVRQLQDQLKQYVLQNEYCEDLIYSLKNQLQKYQENLEEEQRKYSILQQSFQQIVDSQKTTILIPEEDPKLTKSAKKKKSQYQGVKNFTEKDIKYRKSKQEEFQYQHNLSANYRLNQTADSDVKTMSSSRNENMNFSHIASQPQNISRLMTQSSNKVVYQIQTNNSNCTSPEPTLRYLQAPQSYCQSPLPHNQSPEITLTSPVRQNLIELQIENQTPLHLQRNKQETNRQKKTQISQQLDSLKYNGNKIGNQSHRSIKSSTSCRNMNSKYAPSFMREKAQQKKFNLVDKNNQMHSQNQAIQRQQIIKQKSNLNYQKSNIKQNIVNHSKNQEIPRKQQTPSQGIRYTVLRLGLVSPLNSTSKRCDFPIAEEQIKEENTNQNNYDQYSKEQENIYQNSNDSKHYSNKNQESVSKDTVQNLQQ